jgi:type II protein arginine methyltransferase
VRKLFVFFFPFVSLGFACLTPLCRSDLLFKISEWQNYIVGAISPWINLDAVDPLLRADSVAAFRQELAWSSHISMSAVILPTPSAFPYNYAHVVAEALQTSSYAQLMVRIPMLSRKALLAESGADREAVLQQKSHLGRPLHDSWEWWNTLREMCDHHHNLNLALEVTADLPSKEVCDDSCFFLTTLLFPKNYSRGFFISIL